jgi:hypothetical protein
MCNFKNLVVNYKVLYKCSEKHVCRIVIYSVKLKTCYENVHFYKSIILNAKHTLKYQLVQFSNCFSMWKVLVESLNISTLWFGSIRRLTNDRSLNILKSMIILNSNLRCKYLV